VEKAGSCGQGHGFLSGYLYYMLRYLRFAGQNLSATVAPKIENFRGKT
jgi:hypothetical protein